MGYPLEGEPPMMEISPWKKNMGTSTGRSDFLVDDGGCIMRYPRYPKIGHGVLVGSFIHLVPIF